MDLRRDSQVNAKIPTKSKTQVPTTAPTITKVGGPEDRAEFDCAGVGATWTVDTLNSDAKSGSTLMKVGPLLLLLLLPVRLAILTIVSMSGKSS